MSDRQMVIVVVFMFLVAVLLGAVAIVGLAHAHDHARPELNGWFDKLQSNNGICCSGNDGRTVLDADWESHRRSTIACVSRTSGTTCTTMQ